MDAVNGTDAARNRLDVPRLYNGQHKVNNGPAPATTLVLTKLPTSIRADPNGGLSGQSHVMPRHATAILPKCISFLDRRLGMTFFLLR